MAKKTGRTKSFTALPLKPLSIRNENMAIIAHTRAHKFIVCGLNGPLSIVCGMINCFHVIHWTREKWNDQWYVSFLCVRIDETLGHNLGVTREKRISPKTKGQQAKTHWMAENIHITWLLSIRSHECMIWEWLIWCHQRHRDNIKERDKESGGPVRSSKLI